MCQTLTDKVCHAAFPSLLGYTTWRLVTLTITISGETGGLKSMRLIYIMCTCTCTYNFFRYNIHLEGCTRPKYVLTVFRSVPVGETTAWTGKRKLTTLRAPLPISFSFHFFFPKGNHYSKQQTAFCLFLELG